MKFEFSSYDKVQYITHNQLHTTMIKLLFGGSYHNTNWGTLIWQECGWSRNLNKFFWDKVEIDDDYDEYVY